jgi:hypothetical protein
MSLVTATPMRLPYNHRSDRRDRAPLPFRQGDVPSPGRYIIEGWTLSTAHVQTASGRELRIGLDTDSAHLAIFFKQNWPQRPSVPEPLDGHIILARATTAGDAAPTGEPPAIVVSPDVRRAQIPGREYYTKVKTTLRAICSALAPPHEIFLHGCTLDVDGIGLMICGESGAGKTTLARAIMAQAGAAIVNDDWGPLSLIDFTATYTGEARLHMKYRTVSSMRPELAINPNRYASEDFRGDPQDPRARLMIPRGDVFGAHRIADTTCVRHVLFISRNDPSASFARPLSLKDAAVLARQDHTPSIIRSSYLDAASLLDHPRVAAQQAQRHQRLLASGHCVAINSHGDPTAVAARVLHEILGAGTRKRASPIAMEATL